MMLEKIRELLSGKDERTKYQMLKNSKPKDVIWITQPKQKWYVAFNSTSYRLTTSDIFSSELGVINYPIGISEMSIPKYFIPHPMLIRMFYSLEWPGGDLRPESKYRALKRPGVVEVLY